MTAEALRNVTDYLQDDHRRLDAILPDVKSSVAEGDFQRAGDRFAEFSRGLGRHIDIEEQILFPFFEQTTGMVGGPTAVMRSEHVEIRRWMNDVTAALKAADAAGVETSIRGLKDILSAHNMKEERILYPMTDRAAGNDSAREELVKRLQAF